MTEDLHTSEHQLPQVILDVEMAELGIVAGLQDRVVQVFGGVVHMDFGKHHLDTMGHGIYTVMSPKVCYWEPQVKIWMEIRTVCQARPQFDQFEPHRF